MPQRAVTRLSPLVHRPSFAVSSFKDVALGAFGIAGAGFCSLPLLFWLGLAAVS